ncbi:MAG TPA: amidohydrolase [Bacteroidales bacterium]|nr:amidohydrolase [Bacteroidales bacterium]
MKATIIQTDLKWEDKDANIAHLSSLLDNITGSTDLVVLPEMFTTAFSMNPGTLAETMEGPSVKWMTERSSTGNYALCGSLIIEEDGKYFNRLIFVTPTGIITKYDKRHLHSISGEHTVYTAGDKQVICKYKKLNFNLQVCYDLRFPVWSRNKGNSDVIIYSANWPGVRGYAWRSLLVARAIENQCFVLGTNRIGTSPDGTSYSGDSVIIGPKGELLGSLSPDAEGIITAELLKESLDKYRSDMPVWRDSDPFTLG